MDICSNLKTLQWHYNERDGISNHQPHDCFLDLLLRRRLKKNIKAPRHLPLWGEFTGDQWIPTQRASNAEIVSIWWRHLDIMPPAPPDGRRFSVNWTLRNKILSVLKPTACSGSHIKEHQSFTLPGIIFCMCSANERQRYNVTSSLIGWAHT